MCGRFFTNDKILRAAALALRIKNEELKILQPTGDIRPTDFATVISVFQNRTITDTKRWGFPGFGQQKVIINAKAETVFEKRMFRESILKHRIVVPAAGFYEWNKAKEKGTFTAKDSAVAEETSILYMAGFYDRFQGEDRFVILTTEANESMRDTHDRMPLILEPNEVEAWLYEDESVEELLRKKPASLHKKMEYEQQILVFE